MNKIKGIAILLLFSALMNACLTEPKFSNTPHIEFNEIKFNEIGGLTDPDELVIAIDFQDGDGDLGLLTDVIDSPYHATNFFTDINGELIPLSSRIQSLSGLRYKSNRKSPKDISYVLGHIPKNSGKLITAGDKPTYSSLPPFAAPYSTCSANLQAYLRDTIFVEPKYSHALVKATIVDSLVNPANEIVYYAVLSDWYIESNEGNYNIFVKFEVKSPADNEFHEFDWRKEYCSTYDGRIPPFVDTERLIDGTLRYTMKSTGFITVFGKSTLRLKLQVQDRNFNKSNVVTTPEFILRN